MNNCKKVPDCPKGIRRDDLIIIAQSCEIPGWETEYKRPYRNMKWLCNEIDKKVDQLTVKTQPAKVKIQPTVKTQVKIQPTKVKTRPVAKLTDAQRAQILQDYQAYWIREYDIDPNLPELSKLGRERYIKKVYGDTEGLRKARKEEFIELMQEKMPDVSAHKIQQALRKEILCQPCTNLSIEEQYQIDPLNLIRLVVHKDGQKYCVCYDVQVLYKNLTDKYGISDKDVKTWSDPVHGVVYSDAQIRRIKNAWSKSRPGSPTRTQLESVLQLSKN